MDPFSSFAPLRSGAPLANGNAAPDDAASAIGLTATMAAFLSVFTGRTPPSHDEGQRLQMCGDARQNDARHPDFAEIEAPETDITADSSSNSPVPAVPASPLPTLPDRQAADTEPSLIADIPDTGTSNYLHAGHGLADRNPAPNPVLRSDLRPPETPTAPRPQGTGCGPMQVTVTGPVGSDPRSPDVHTAQGLPAAPIAGQKHAMSQEFGRQPDRNFPGAPIIVESARLAKAAIPRPDAARHITGDNAMEKWSADPGQTAETPRRVEVQAPVAAPGGNGAIQMPKPEHPIPVSFPPSGPVDMDAAEQPLHVPAPPSDDIARQAAAETPAQATPPTTPVRLAVHDPAFLSLVENSIAFRDGTTEITVGADTVPPPRAEHREGPVMQALPQGLGQRLAETVAQFPDRPVEVTLSPEELGRVRMSLSTQDGILTMSVLADRPETLDLLRRNIDQLAQDFRDLGFHDLSFSFGDRPSPQSPERIRDEAGGEGDSDGLAASPPRARPMRAAPAADGGLDMRL